MGVAAEHIVVREPIEVMFVRVADQLPEIQRAWASFEAVVGLRGRKFYGAFDPVTATYSVCAVLRPGDDPAVFGAECGTLPGGRYACVRLQGEPPAVYAEILLLSFDSCLRPDCIRRTRFWVSSSHDERDRRIADEATCAIRRRPRQLGPSGQSCKNDRGRATGVCKAFFVGRSDTS
jgi:hypothetical protein